VDEIIKFCRHDGAALINEVSTESAATLIFSSAPRSAEIPTQPVSHAPSIAVLPFVNLSADAEYEYFCDGLAEELLNALAKIDSLKVAARTSAFSFKGKNEGVGHIGKLLNVETILEGSVRKSGSRIRIMVQLINAADGFHIWSERYDREMQNIFDVQDEITLAVVDALKVKLLGDEKTALLKRGTENIEAFELYLRGLFYFNKRTADDLRKAIGMFRQAVERDPGYALAHVGIANCYLVVGLYAGTRAHEVLPPAKAAATRALEIDNSLAEAHATLGHFYFRLLQWQEAEQEIRRAIELNPSYAMAHYWYSEYYRALMRYDEAMKEVKRALELDPLSPLFGMALGLAHLNLGDLEAALREWHQVLEMAPNFAVAHLFLASAYRKLGRSDEAVAEARKAAEVSGGSSLFLGMLGYIYALTGKRAEALSFAGELEEKHAAGEIVGFNLAQVYIGLKNNDRAMTYLERDFEAGDTILLTNVTVFFFYDHLYDDSRYQNLLRRMGLPV
jgi:TolB-like protein/Tfp pilus assembly protein PilF